MKRTQHIGKRVSQRGISFSMIYWTVNHGEIVGDKYVSTKKMVRRMVDYINARIAKLNRLRRKFKHFGVTRLIDRALQELNMQKKIALKIVAKGGIVVVVAEDTLITAYDLNSYKKY